MMYEYDEYLRYCEEIGVCEKPESLNENKTEQQEENAEKMYNNSDTNHVI